MATAPKTLKQDPSPAPAAQSQAKLDRRERPSEPPAALVVATPTVSTASGDQRDDVEQSSLQDKSTVSLVTHDEYVAPDIKRRVDKAFALLDCLRQDMQVMPVKTEHTSDQEPHPSEPPSRQQKVTKDQDSAPHAASEAHAENR